MKLTTVAAAAVLSLVLAACSGGGTASSASSSALGESGSSLTDFCNSICGRQHTCDTTSELQTCTSNCQNENAAMFPTLRGDIVTSIEACLPDEDCATVLKGNALTECVSEAVASVAPTADGTAFCDDWGSAVTSCGQTLDKATCLSLAKEYNDTTLQTAQSCTTKSCSSMSSCIDAVLNLSGS